MTRSNKTVFHGILDLEPAERLLWIPDLTWWRDAQMIQGVLPWEYRGDEGFLQLHRDLGVMPYYIYALERSGKPAQGLSVHQIGGENQPYNGVWGLSYDGVDVEQRRSGEVTDTLFHVDGSQLVQSKRYLPDSYCHAFLEYPVKSPKDFGTLQKIIERYRFCSTEQDFGYLAALWGDEGVPIAPLPRSPLSALIVDWLGIVNLTFAWHDDPAPICKLLQCIDEVNEEGFRIITGSEARIFHFCDNLSAANYGSFFDQLAAGYYCKRVNQLHAAGQRCVVHLDGTIVGLLDRLAACGMDGIEAITPKPVGTVAAKDLRALARNNCVVLWGGLPAAIFVPSFPRDQFETYLQELIAIAKVDKRMIIGSADQISPDAEMDRVQRVSEVIKRGDL